MKCVPVIVNESSRKTESLVRFVVPSNSRFDEDWLQGLIFDNPMLIPSADFDETFSPLIPLGREIPVSVGYVDNLYVSPAGKLTIVETKLWKNPEKHRSVVAQIIDYAKDIANWTYDELNSAVIQASRAFSDSSSNTIEQLVKPQINHLGIPFVEFQEKLINNLEKGEFLLLIVGEKISARVALLSEAIHGAPGLGFTMGLVELQMYQKHGENKGDILVIPSIIGKTIEEIRGVVKVSYQKEKPSVEIKVVEEKRRERKTTSILTKEAFLFRVHDEFRDVLEQYIEAWDNCDGLRVEWVNKSFKLVSERVTDDIVVTYFAILDFDIIRKDDFKKWGLVEGQYEEYLDILGDSPLVDKISRNKRNIKYETINQEILKSALDAITYVAELIRDSVK